MSLHCLPMDRPACPCLSPVSPSLSILSHWLQVSLQSFLPTFLPASLPLPAPSHLPCPLLPSLPAFKRLKNLLFHVPKTLPTPHENAKNACLCKERHHPLTTPTYAAHRCLTQQCSCQPETMSSCTRCMYRGVRCEVTRGSRQQGRGGRGSGRSVGLGVGGGEKGHESWDRLPMACIMHSPT